MIAAIPRNIREAIAHDCKHNIHVFAEHGMELRVNATRTSKPVTFSMLGSIATLSVTAELKLRAEKEKSITCGYYQRSYGLFELRE